MVPRRSIVAALPDMAVKIAILPLILAQHGTLSITSSTDIHSLESLEKYKPELLATSEQIGKEAGAWSFPEKSIN